MPIDREQHRGMLTAAGNRHAYTDTGTEIQLGLFVQQSAANKTLICVLPIFKPDKVNQQIYKAVHTKLNKRNKPSILSARTSNMQW